MTLNLKFEHLSKVTAHLLRHSLCEVFARLIGPTQTRLFRIRITLTLNLLFGLMSPKLHPLPKSSMWVTYESDKAKGKEISSELVMLD